MTHVSSRHAALKPKVRDHYHSHRLSYWLNLIPKLNQPGLKGTSFEYHLLHDHENPQSYEGVVRETRFGSKLVSPSSSSTGSCMPSLSNEEMAKCSSAASKESLKISSGNGYFVNGTFHVAPSSESSLEPKVPISDSIQHKSSSLNHSSSSSRGLMDPSSSSIGIHILNNSNNTWATLDTKSTSEGRAKVPVGAAGESSNNSSNYSTALSVTISIGVTFLILNVLLLLRILYKKDANASAALRNLSGSKQAPDCNDHSAGSESNVPTPRSSSDILIPSPSHNRSKTSSASENKKKRVHRHRHGTQDHANSYIPTSNSSNFNRVKIIIMIF